MTLDEWIIKGEVGTSSKTIWAVMKGIETTKRKLNISEGYDIPYDPDDFRRCYLLVDNCNLRSRLDEVSNIFPAWEPYIRNWDKLVSLLMGQLETRKQNGMYEFIQTLETESKVIDGWKESAIGSWQRNSHE